MAFDGELRTDVQLDDRGEALFTAMTSHYERTRGGTTSYSNLSPTMIEEGLERLEALARAVERLPVICYNQDSFGGEVNLGFVRFFRACAMGHAERLGMIDNLDGGATMRNATHFGLLPSQAAQLFAASANVNGILGRNPRHFVGPRTWARAARVLISRQRAKAQTLSALLAP